MLLGAAAGCLEVPAEFRCEWDDECVMRGEQGVCVDEGWCAFEDALCASGLRYAEHSVHGRAGYCVPDDAGDGLAVDSVR